MLRIKDWSAKFENHETRKYKTLQWVPLPNKLDGSGITELLAMPDGLRHFGVWCALLEIASKDSVKRGELGRSGKNGRIGHNASSLALILRSTEAIISAGISALLQIGWLEEVADNLPESPGTPGETAGSPGETAGISRQTAAELNRIELNRIEGEDSARLADNEKNASNLTGSTDTKPEIDPADRWKLERLEPWAKRLAACCGTLGPKTWQIYKAIVDRYGLDRTERVARRTIGQWKWPDDLAKIMAECEQAEPEPEFQPSLSSASLQAIAYYEKHGSKIIRQVMGWQAAEESGIRLGLSDQENAEYFLANHPRLEV